MHSKRPLITILTTFIVLSACSNDSQNAKKAEPSESQKTSQYQIDPQSLIVGRGHLTLSYLPNELPDFQVGYFCYAGTFSENSNLNKSFYLVHSKVYPDGVREFSIGAYNIKASRNLSDVTLSPEYHDLKKMTKKERRERCGDQVVVEDFSGLHVEVHMSYAIPDGSPRPKSFDIWIENNEEGRQKLRTVYGPEFNRLNQGKATRTFESNPWLQQKDLTEAQRKDASEVVINYIEMAEKVKTSASVNNRLQLFRREGAPPY